MVKKVWGWLGEGPTLQNTQIFCDVDGGGGDRGRGMASRHGDASGDNGSGIP